MPSRFRLIKSQKGIAALFISLIVLGIVSYVVLYLTNSSVVGTKIVANDYRQAQAFESAQSGLDYGLAYLLRNYNEVVDDPVSGKINPDIGSMENPLTQSSAGYSNNFNVVFDNPIPNDYDLMQITATGFSKDGKVNKTLAQQFMHRGFFSNVPTTPLAVGGTASLSGNSTIVNSEKDFSVWANTQDDVTIAGSAYTEGLAGKSEKVGQDTVYGGDINANPFPEGSSCGESFFSEFFGLSSSQLKQMADVVYESHNGNLTISNPPSSAKFIWVDVSKASGEGYFTATISSNSDIGTEDDPAVIIVIGNLKLTGTAHVNGFIFATGDIEASAGGNFDLTGGMAICGSLETKGNADLEYSSTALNGLNDKFNILGKLSGSWQDV